MAATATYSASMRTRKTSSSGNAKSAVACQEYYDDSYNYVGIVHFSGMALSGKVITGISLRVKADQAGYGGGHTKTVYVRKEYHERIQLILRVIGKDEVSLFSYIDNVLAHHFDMFQEDIKRLYEQNNNIF